MAVRLWFKQLFSMQLTADETDLYTFRKHMQLSSKLSAYVLDAPHSAGTKWVLLKDQTFDYSLERISYIVQKLLNGYKIQLTFEHAYAGRYIVITWSK
jgi:hypothetical protein